MWPVLFEERLSSWVHLRQHAPTQDIESMLHDINLWWGRCPTVNRYLHWDDKSNNNFCNLAKALGIVYTILMVEHPDVKQIQIAQTDEDNLVLINHGKYILNWTPREVVNIESINTSIKKTIDASELIHFIK
jgi:hypothetical protein